MWPMNIVFIVDTTILSSSSRRVTSANLTSMNKSKGSLRLRAQHLINTTYYATFMHLADIMTLFRHQMALLLYPVPLFFVYGIIFVRQVCKVKLFVVNFSKVENWEVINVQFGVLFHKTYGRRIFILLRFIMLFFYFCNQI